jgi:diacylglycerol kinase (ATP)
LKGAGIDLEIALTTRAGDARSLAAAADVDAVIVVGGDGSVHEVASGLIAGRSRAALGIIPAGSGNDFARALGLRGGLSTVVSMLSVARPVLVDHGRVTWHSETLSGESIFFNAVGCGFDAYVADRARMVRHLRGYPRYLVAALRSLRTWTSPEASITCDGFSWHGDMLLCTVGNGVSSGGGFMLTPRAAVDDGRLDMCLARDMPVGRILVVLPRALVGSHLSAPEISYKTLRTVDMEFGRGIPVHVDGEIVSADVRKVSVEIVRGGLNVLRPAPEP